jgi:hypothetical protein
VMRLQGSFSFLLGFTLLNIFNLFDLSFNFHLKSFEEENLHGAEPIR